MSVDFERALRSEMERAPIAPRPGLVREAYRRSRQRQRATRAGIAAGTAVLSAATAVGVVTAGTTPTADSGAASTVALMDHLTSALANTNDVLEVSEGKTPPDDFYGKTTALYYGDTQRIQIFDRSGRPTLDYQQKTSTRTSIAVDYSARTATISPLRPIRVLPDHVTCDMAGTQPISETLLNSPGRSRPAAMAAAMRTLLGCGTIKITAHQRFHGIEATKMDFRDPRYPKIQQTLWVDESTFLPAQGVFTLLGGKFKDDFTTSFTWLPPTSANKDRLSVAYPAGFRVVRSSAANIWIPYLFAFGAPCPAADCTPEPAPAPSPSPNARK